MKLVIFKSEKNFIKSTINFILKILKKTSTNIALSGGSTPKPIYKNLAKKLPAKKANFYQVDERYIHPTHPDSNQKMIRETLNPKNFHRFDTSIPIQKSLKKYQKELPKTGFDLTILGIGHDGHTASIFPNSKAINSKSPVAHTTTKNFPMRTHGASTQQANNLALPVVSAASLPIKDRLTLTFAPILKSKKILVLLKGKEKIPILKILQKKSQKPSKISSLEIKKFPALKLLNHPQLTIHFSA